MLSKNKIKFILSLHQKKYRQKYNKFIVEGSKICRDILHQNTLEPETIIASAEWFDNQAYDLRNVERIVVSPLEMKKITTLNTPSPVLMICNIPNATKSEDFQGHYIFLDQVRDPGNVGTIIRTADWFGITGILVSPDCVEIYSPKVIQSAMGSLFRMTIQPTTYDQLAELSKKVSVLIADMNGEQLINHKFAETSIMVFGNEGKGISGEVIKMTSDVLSISKAPEGSGAESLNVAIAAGIFMEAMARSRMKVSPR